MQKCHPINSQGQQSSSRIDSEVSCPEPCTSRGGYEGHQQGYSSSQHLGLLDTHLAGVQLRSASGSKFKSGKEVKGRHRTSAADEHQHCTEEEEAEVEGEETAQGQGSTFSNAAADIPSAARSKDKRDASVLTDVHTSEDLPEVEICSLIEDQIPKYKLRSSPVGPSALVSPTGERYPPPQDFLDHEQVFEASGELEPLEGGIINRRASPPPPIQLSDLSADFLNQFFSFFMIGGERIAQMTKTYNDIEAVTKLLEEKEHDLELAARIGQALLQENVLLKSQNDELNVFCDQLNDKVKQLKHDNDRKTEMLNMFYQEEAHLEGEIEGAAENDAPIFDITTSRSSVELVGMLQRKLELLERENGELRQSTEECLVKTDYYEAKEESLLKECVAQLSQANSESRQLKSELENRSNALHKQQEEKTKLLGELVQLQKKYNNLTVEYENVMSELETLHECTEDLAQELSQVKTDYEKCASMLQETQSELTQYCRNNNSTAPPINQTSPAHIILNHRTTPQSNQTALNGTAGAAGITNSKRGDTQSPPQSLASEIQSALQPEEVAKKCSNIQARQVVRELVTSRLGKRHRRDKIPGSNTGPLSAVGVTSTPTKNHPAGQKGYFPFGAQASSSGRGEGFSSGVGGTDMQTAIRRLGASRQNEVDYKMFRRSNCMELSDGHFVKEETSNVSRKHSDEIEVHPCQTKDKYVEGWLNSSLNSTPPSTHDRSLSSSTAVHAEHSSLANANEHRSRGHQGDDHLCDEAPDSCSDVTAVGHRDVSPSYSNLGSSVSQVSPRNEFSQHARASSRGGVGGIQRKMSSGREVRGSSLRGRPEKLQIVKPLEGSETLSQWQKLASTDITQALFDDRPGVVARGESGLSSVGGAGSVPASIASRARSLTAGVLNSTECDLNDSQSVFSSLPDVEEDDVEFSGSLSTKKSKRSQRLSVFSDPNDSMPSHFDKEKYLSMRGGGTKAKSKTTGRAMVLNRGDAAHCSTEATTPTKQSSPSGGLAVLCHSCSSAVAKSQNTPNQLKTPVSNTCHVSQLYNSPFYTFAATSPVESSDPVPPRILQILGFSQPGDAATVVSRSEIDDNIPIRNSPEDEIPGRASHTVAVLSRLRSAIMGSTGYNY